MSTLENLVLLATGSDEVGLRAAINTMPLEKTEFLLGQLQKRKPHAVQRRIGKLLLHRMKELIGWRDVDDIMNSDVYPRMLQAGEALWGVLAVTKNEREWRLHAMPQLIEPLGPYKSVEHICALIELYKTPKHQHREKIFELLEHLD